MTLSLNPIFPIWLIVAAGLLGLAFLFQGTRLLLYKKHIPRSWVMGLAVLRLLAILIFLLCLLRPSLSYLRSQVQASDDLLVLIDASRSMGLQPANAGGSRLDRALDSLQRDRFKNDFLDRFNVAWFAFDHDARLLARRELAGLKADGEDTRYAESLASAWNGYRLSKAREAKSSRILLVSDGRDRSAQDAVQQAQRLGLTVDVLAPPGEERPPASPLVDIVGVQTPRRVLLGSESRFLVTVRRHNADKIPLRLTLAEEGKEVLRRDFEFAGAETEHQLSLAYQPASAGIKRYALRVAPRAAAPTSAPPYEVSVKVDSGKNEVLLLEDSWRWEFKFLRRVLEKDPSFSFTGFLARDNGGFYLQFCEPDRRVSLGGFPQTREELSWFDTFIVGDVNPVHWPKALAPALYELVVEEGKSLVIIAGPNLKYIQQTPELEALLPVDLSPVSQNPVPGPIPIRIAPEGRASPLFFYGAAAGQRWPELPPLDQVYAPLRKKPAATILLEAVGRANEYGPLIVAAEHTVGRGRVLFLGTDCLWKWQMIPTPDADGNTPYNIFWQQALRALQPGRLSGGNASLWLQSDRSRYLAGQTVRLHFEIRSDRPLEHPVIEAKVTLPDGRKVPLALVPQSAQSGQYRSEFQVDAPGQYRIGAVLLSEERLVADAESIIDVQAPEPENAPGPVNLASLERLAAATGGKLIVPDDPATWPAASGKDKTTIRQARTVNLWSGYALLLALVAVLGLDWLFRLLRGLV